MKQSAKRSLSIFLSLIMIFSLFAGVNISSSAASADDLTYEIIDGEVIITGCNRGSIDELVIPDTINGYPVTTIKEKAFYGIIDISSIVIPDSIIMIGARAFDDCWGNTSIIVDENNQMYSSDEYGVLFNKDKTVLIKYPTGYGDYDDELPRNDVYVVPDSVTSISAYAFYDCLDRLKLTIPDSVTSIGESAFGESRLTSITIPNSITTIQDKTFIGCSAISSITIPDSVTSIGEKAFFDCDGLSSITIPGNVTSIGKNAFTSCDRIENVTLCDGVTSIGDFAFSNCCEITSITIPDSVTYIGSGAFLECLSLSELVVDGNNEKYCSDEFGVMFNKDRAILMQYPIGNERTEYVVPICVTTIDSLAFLGCFNLVDITIPKGISSIGNSAFLGCENLSNVHYCGTEEEWNAISIDNTEGLNENLLNATIHFLGHGDENNNTIVSENGVSVEFEKGVFPENINIAVTADEITDGEAFVILREHKNNAKAQLFDINIVDENGNKVQPNGEVLVKVPMPNGYQEKATGVYYISPDGTLEKLESYCKDGYVYFKTTHFSVYAIVEELPDNNNGDWSIVSLIKRGWELLQKIFNFIKKLFGG